jgi:thiamine-monophosphate kinase
VLGGDLSQAPILIVDVCAVGTAPRPVRRRGAEVGDGLWVTGRLGAMELALRELRAGRKPEPSLLARFAGPEPRLQAGQWLASQGARAMIDLSDGLSGDSRHLAAASGVALEISLDRLPCWPGAAPLLVAMPPAFGETQAQAFSGLVGTQLARIGTCVDGPGGSVRFTERGVEVATPAGYDHFAA